MVQEAANQSSTFLSYLAIWGPLLTGGLAGAVLTYVLKTRADNRQKKIISVNTTEFALSPQGMTEEHILPTGSVKVSFEDQIFEHLRLYTVFVKNVGFRAVEGLKLVLSFPAGVTQIRTITKSEPVAISCTLENTIQKDDQTETMYGVGRLEKDDRVRLSLLVDANRSNVIKCVPRGIDDVELIITKDEYREAVHVRSFGPSYKLVFLSISIFTLFGLIVQIVLVLGNPSTPALVQLQHLSETFVKLGAGTVFGLIAGKILY